MRAFRFAFDSRRVRRVVCPSTALAPLAATTASNTPATHFTFNLKPNINDYSCTSCALLWWNLGIRLLEQRPILIRTSEARPGGALAANTCRDTCQKTHRNQIQTEPGESSDKY